MADGILIAVPFGLAVFFLALAIAGGWIGLAAGDRSQTAAPMRALRRDAAIFSLGALLLAGFFLFTAGFFHFMG